MTTKLKSGESLYLRMINLLCKNHRRIFVLILGYPINTSVLNIFISILFLISCFIHLFIFPLWMNL